MGEMVTYRGEPAVRRGYLAVPSDGAASPGVIVLPERWGLVPHIVSVAERFAAAGFVALALDLYHGETTGDPDRADELTMALATDQIGRDLAAAADYLASRAEVSGPIGCVGFGTGGSLALWSAAVSDRIGATAAFYPALSWDRLGPDWSGYAGRHAVIHCAERDDSAGVDGIPTVRRAIEAAGGECVVYEYPGTGHAFFNDDRPDVFDQPAAASAWARTLDQLRTRLG